MRIVCGNGKFLLFGLLLIQNKYTFSGVLSIVIFNFQNADYVPACHTKAGGMKYIETILNK